MGNQMCCDDLRQDTNPVEKLQEVELSKQHPQPIEVKQQEEAGKVADYKVEKQQILRPELNQNIQKILEKHKFFYQELLKSNLSLKRYGEDIYQGEISEESGKPHGLGKFYKGDGSLYIGYFKSGRADGKGAFIFSDGSYYTGGFKDNKACCPDGYYQTTNFRYLGGFKDNLFDGRGKQEGNSQSFEGDYVGGKKSLGLLKWNGNNNFEYSYSGRFNQKQQFEGNGVLVDDNGKYEGSFVAGVREGKGRYKSLNGVVYQGDYKNDLKQGYGIIYNSDGSISYKGQLKAGLPHGKGSVYNKGHELDAEFFEGIDIRMLKITQ